MVLKNLNYPLDFTFKIATLASDFNITDSQGNYVCYVRQKMFKLKEDVVVFSDETKSNQLYNIKANKWIDFNASYSINDISTGNAVGTLARKGMRSIWKASYDILDGNKEAIFHIAEKNPWVKFFDGMVGELPVVGMFTGYFLNPTYLVTDKSGNAIFELKKMPSFFGRKFQLNRIKDIDDTQETLIILSLLIYKTQF